MDSYREAFDCVMSELPSAHPADSGYETDSMFILPPEEPEEEGSPVYFGSKKDSGVLSLGSGAWRKIDQLMADPSRRPASIGT